MYKVKYKNTLELERAIFSGIEIKYVHKSYPQLLI